MNHYNHETALSKQLWMLANNVMLMGPIMCNIISRWTHTQTHAHTPTSRYMSSDLAGLMSVWILHFNVNTASEHVSDNITMKNRGVNNEPQSQDNMRCQCAYWAACPSMLMKFSSAGFLLKTLDWYKWQGRDIPDPDWFYLTVINLLGVFVGEGHSKRLQTVIDLTPLTRKCN